MLEDNTLTFSTPLIVEIIGLAGAGKTTLLRSLCLQNDKILPGDYIQVRNPISRAFWRKSGGIRHMPYIIKNALLSLPTFFSQPQKGRWFNRREITKILYLRGWHRILKQHSSKNDVVLIVDQGAIYDLTTLHAFGPEKLSSQHYKVWWEKMFDQWARTVDLVIWLDAPEEILIKRIRSRKQRHPVKENSAHEMRDYLLRYQSSYEHVITELMARHDVNILRFDTSTQPLEDIISQVLSTIRIQGIEAFHYDHSRNQPETSKSSQANL
ncbi:MAG: nucleoside/nucleotide kinase family protein [Planctomycetota bacterium]|jgi:deoxyadenosine/deoxycytidine kinase